MYLTSEKLHVNHPRPRALSGNHRNSAVLNHTRLLNNLKAITRLASVVMLEIIKIFELSNLRSYFRVQKGSSKFI